MVTRPKSPPEDLRSLVGEPIFSAWLETLRTIVPDGRTHRLAVVIAGMLAHAAEAARRLPRSRRRGPLVDMLIDPTEVCSTANEYTSDDGPFHPLEDLVVGLFLDAGVEHRRMNSRGDGYSIISSAVYEYLHWFDMPWE